MCVSLSIVRDSVHTSSLSRICIEAAREHFSPREVV